MPCWLGHWGVATGMVPGKESSTALRLPVEFRFDRQKAA
jgi:hypothetical protein